MTTSNRQHGVDGSPSADRQHGADGSPSADGKKAGCGPPSADGKKAGGGPPLSSATTGAETAGGLLGRAALRGLKEIGKALLITAFSAAVALTVNAARGKKGGGLDLVARAPYDIYTDCPEMSETLPKLKVSELPRKSPHVIYVDARPAIQFLSGHVPGARSMPMYGSRPNAPGGIDWLKRLRGRFVVVTGRDGIQSATHLASWLQQQGVRGVHLMEGDLDAWKKAGRPLEQIEIPRIDPAQLQERPAVRFVDARPGGAYRDGHLPGAVSVPFNGLVPPPAEPFARLLASKEPIVVYGLETVDPELADPDQPAEPRRVGLLLAAELLALGAREVALMPGGVQAWKQAGGRLVSAGDRGSDEAEEPRAPEPGQDTRPRGPGPGGKP